MKRVFYIFILFVLGLILCQCEKIDQEPDPPDTAIRLTSISPGERVSHAPGFLLTASGTNFKTDSVILFNGIQQDTTFVSSSQLTCEIDSSEIIFSESPQPAAGLSAGRFKSQDLPVLVQTPSENNHETQSTTFVVRDNHKFNTTDNIYDSDYDSRYPSAVMDNAGNVHAVWQDHVPASHQIYYSTLSSGGDSWSAPFSLSGPGDFRMPDLALDSQGNLNAVWYDNNNNARDIYISRSADSSANWSTALNLSNTLRGSFDPVIAAGAAGNLYVAWIDDTPGTRTTVFNRSFDHGGTWDGFRVVSNMTGIDNNADIAVDSRDNVYIVWFQEGFTSFSLYFTRSLDRGDTWSTPLRLTTLTTSSSFPRIAVDSGGVIHVVFGDNQGFSQYIYTMRSSDNGTTWTPRMNISLVPGSAEDYWNPVLVLDSADNLNVSWIGTASSGDTLYYCRSIDGGQVFGFVDSNPGFLALTDMTAVVDAKGDLHVIGGNFIQTENKVRLYYSNSGSAD